MGVSGLWLGLIDDIITGTSSSEDNTSELLEQYRLANNNNK